MSLDEFIGMLRRYWISILVLIAVGMSYTISSVLLLEPTYSATANVLFSLQITGSSDSECQIEVSLDESARSLASVVGTPLIIDPVIEKLGLPMDFDTVSPMVYGQLLDGTSVVRIWAVAPDPELAAKLATAAAEQVAAVANDTKHNLPEGTPFVVGSTTGAAAIPTAPNNRPGLQQQALLGALAGAFVGVAQAWVRHRLRQTSRNPADPA